MTSDKFSGIVPAVFMYDESLMTADYYDAHLLYLRSVENIFGCARSADWQIGVAGR